jgi:hypothetical protein
MGAWGFKVMDNDVALDYVDDLLESAGVSHIHINVNKKYFGLKKTDRDKIRNALIKNYSRMDVPTKAETAEWLALGEVFMSTGVPIDESEYHMIRHSVEVEAGSVIAFEWRTPSERLRALADYLERLDDYYQKSSGGKK